MEAEANLLGHVELLAISFRYSNISLIWFEQKIGVQTMFITYHIQVNNWYLGKINSYKKRFNRLK